jgi:ADP-dependent NAD(P)H-hydrate dehydratase / NAD(P)H-hydrate epimerase
MRPVLSRKQIRGFDRRWMQMGVPGLVLMENAGRGAAHLIGQKARPRAPGERPWAGSSVVGSCVRCADERSLAGVLFVIVAGPGNNGGDGFVVARHLSARGAKVRVFGSVREADYHGDAQAALFAMEAVGVPLERMPAPAELKAELQRADIVVDALLGTGADRPVEGELAGVIRGINESGARVIALDIPSGLDADTGAELGVAVHAVHTVTFAHLKLGLLSTHGHERAGTLTVSNIGVPSDLPSGEKPAAWLLEESDIRGRLEARSRASHKGDSGRIVLIAGSAGTVGAARLASRACLRAGAGLVTIFSDEETVSQLQQETVEVMTRPFTLPDNEEFLRKADALVVGPGMGQSEEARRLFELVGELGRPTVIDADALRILAIDRQNFLSSRARLFVLTPHPGEAAALLGMTVDEIENNRFAAADRLCQELNCVVVLKGSRTVVAAPGEVPVVSAFGSPALATGGSGDVLAGMMGALLVGAETEQEVFVRAQVAVALHGMIAERWERLHGDRGLLPSELTDLLPDVVSQLIRD